MSKKEDDERLWNLVVFKCYATDEEMEDVFPLIAMIGGIFSLGALIYWICGG